MELAADVLFAGRYRLLKELGRGSFGEVWLAQDEQLDMQVAVKVYIALDDRGIEDFKKEYKNAYDLNHPNLLHANHFDICDRRPFLVMPYCPDSALSLIGNCDRDTLWQFIKDVSAGLAYLHSKDIVHHDIKPDNILRTEDGRFVITDFGISTKMRSTLRRNSTRAMNQNPSGGALPYMGPEMFCAKPESVKATDIWAFGVTLYEIITGDLPFFGQGGVMQRNGAEVPELEYEDSEIVKLVKACMAKDTWDRPTAENVNNTTASRLFKQQVSNNSTVKKSPVKVLLVLAALLIVIAAFGFYFLKPEPIISRNTLNRHSESRVNSDALLIRKTFGFENISDDAIVTSSSGLRYYIVSPGDDKRAKANDDVYVTYTVSLIDGTIVDDASNNVIRFKPSRVIKGMQESFGYIGNGGEIALIIPPELAYGERGSGVIPANATLMMHIKLAKIIHVLD
mgnify:CR=1 FL=1